MTAETRQIDSTVSVVTPENISFRYQLAGPFRRFPAFVIDLCIRFAVWMSMLLLMAMAGVLSGGGATLGMTIWLLTWFVLEWFYGGLLETFWNGQTVGKRLMGMRVLRIDGQPINGLQAVMRNILRMVDMMPLIPIGASMGEESPLAIPTFMIGLLTPVVWGHRYQRMGDLVCGTMVVVEARRWLVSVANMEEPEIRELAEQLSPSFQVDHTLSQALASYVERRRYLSPARRAEIARHLGDPLTPRLGLPAETGHDQLLCALYYRTFVAMQKEGPMSGAETSESPPLHEVLPPPENAEV